MRKFTRGEIENRITPLFEVMQSDFPSDARIVITSDSATIEYLHTDMMFLRDDVAVYKAAERLGCKLKEVQDETYQMSIPERPKEDA